MPVAALHLAPVLAAEKSKTAFYVIAGILVAWAVVVSLVVGLRQDAFPAALGGQRAVIAVTAVLVLATATSDVVTSGGSTAAQASTSAGGPVTSLKLAANPGGQLSYDTKQLAAKAGTVAITMTNMAPLEHNVTIAKGGTVLGATPTFKGGTRTVTLTLKPGTYTFYCSVPGHRQAGMEGTLTVS